MKDGHQKTVHSADAASGLRFDSASSTDEPGGWTTPIVMSRLRAIAVLLGLATLVAYLPVASHGFSFFDDNDYITNNSVVQDGLTWGGIKWAFTTGHAANWHPLTWISHMIDCQLFGLRAPAHHIVNVAFHMANVVLLFVLLFRLTRAMWPSAFAAALFAWHPLHVESVAWISERKDLLSVFFALLALLAYERYAQNQLKVEGAKGGLAAPSRSFMSAYFWSVFACGASLLSKPMMVTLPLVMLLLDYWPLDRMSKEALPGSWILRCLVREKWPFFALSFIMCPITLAVQSSGGMVASMEAIPFADRLANVPLAYSRYLLKMIWPTDLAVFYPFPARISPVALVACVALLALISAGAWTLRKVGPYLWVGWLWFLTTLLPVIGLVAIGGLAMADRYSYFPSVGIFLAVALGIGDAANRFHLPRRIVAVACVLVLAGSLACTERQLGYWRDDVSLFTRVVEVTRDTPWVRFRYTGWMHHRLGNALAAAGRRDDALAEYRRALELEPNRAETHKNLGNLLAETGHSQEALAEFEEALRLNPDLAPAHYNLGVLLSQLGRFDEALEHYAEAERLAPDSIAYRLAVAKLLAGSTDIRRAMPEYQIALRSVRQAENPRGGAALPPAKVAPQLVSTVDTAILLAPDGSLWAWGGRQFGLAGLFPAGTFTSTPQRVGPDSDWRAVTATFGHTLAIKTNGTLWGWGRNEDGVLGQPLINSYVREPNRIGTETNWMQLSTGGAHCLGLRSDGSIWGWGDNSHGQAGDGATSNSYEITRIGSGDDWRAIAAGTFTSYALKKNGTLWFWGLDIVGRGAQHPRSPWQIDPSTNWSLVSASGYELVALKTDGTLWIDGVHSPQSPRPGTRLVQVGSDTNWQTAYSSEGAFFFARKRDGTWWVFGMSDRNAPGVARTEDLNLIYMRRWRLDSEPWAFAVGLQNCLWLTRDGTLWNWGERIGSSHYSGLDFLKGKWNRVAANFPEQIPELPVQASEFDDRPRAMWKLPAAVAPGATR